MVEGLVEGNDDAEAGSSTARLSRRPSIEVEEQVDEEGDDVFGQFLNDNSNSEEEGDDVPDQPLVQEDGGGYVEGVGYGGGPSDMSLLHDYHNHRDLSLWIFQKLQDLSLQSSPEKQSHGVCL
jgi:hypothetical protein